MAHNFLHSGQAQPGMSLPSDPKALVDRFLDAIWMERGLSETAEWYRRVVFEGADARVVTLEQLRSFGPPR